MATTGNTRGETLGRVAATALDWLLPPQCLSCRAPVDRQGQVCAECWRGLSFIDGLMCAACGIPFEFELGEDALCGGCLRERPVFTAARAVTRYDDRSRGLVLAFKYADRTAAAPSFGAWMARAGAEMLDAADALVPVPLHRFRLFTRRYNQAALLAHAIARRRAIAVAPDLLVRNRATPSQGGLNPAARAANVRGAIAVRGGRAASVADRRLVVVDDVMTTGATVSACARVLLRAGATAVDVLTLARVVRS
jgi:ComF family protein